MSDSLLRRLQWTKTTYKNRNAGMFAEENIHNKYEKIPRKTYLPNLLFFKLYVRRKKGSVREIKSDKYAIQPSKPSSQKTST